MFEKLLVEVYVPSQSSKLVSKRDKITQKMSRINERLG